MGVTIYFTLVQMQAKVHAGQDYSSYTLSSSYAGKFHVVLKHYERDQYKVEI